MNIHGYDVQPYRAGWVVVKEVKKVHESGERKGQEYTRRKESFYPRLDQCLRHIADDTAKSCESIDELLTLWRSF